MAINYRPELDGLRALAVLAVMLFHSSLNGNRILWWGYGGVDIFFVLSGFLISKILILEIERSGTVDFCQFFLRRAARLIPALLSMLATTSVVFYWLFPALRSPLRSDGIVAALYLMDFAALLPQKDNPYLHTWSLAIEVQFYLVWPVVVLYLSKIPRNAAAAILLMSWVIVTGIRDVIILQGLPQIGFFTPLHSTGLIIGSAIAFMPKLKVGPIIGPLVFAATIALGLSQSWILSLIEIATVLVISHPTQLLGFAPLVWTGKISYGLYLWHIPIWFVVSKNNLPFALPLTYAASFVFASASFYLIEQPILASVGSPKLRSA